MISAARFPSFSILIVAARALSRSGGLRVSHRKQALALVIVAAMGWFISCARELASSPSMVTRFMCARSASSWRSLSRSSSARLRSVTSIELPTNCNEMAGLLRTG